MHLNGDDVICAACIAKPTPAILPISASHNACVELSGSWINKGRCGADIWTGEGSLSEAAQMAAGHGEEEAWLVLSFCWLIWQENLANIFKHQQIVGVVKLQMKMK